MEPPDLVAPESDGEFPAQPSTPQRPVTVHLGASPGTAFATGPVPTGLPLQQDELEIAIDNRVWLVELVWETTAARSAIGVPSSLPNVGHQIVVA